MQYYDTVTSRLASSILRRRVACAVAPRKSLSPSASQPPPPPPPPDHILTLYDFEASPWCRLVREQLTILDLNVKMRPCPRQDLLLQGAYTNESRFRPLAAKEIHDNLPKNEAEEDSSMISLTFPILVDETRGINSNNNRIVIKESYAIVDHLWKEYGKDVIRPAPTRRPDQIMNSSRLPFPLRFLFLSSPSYLRSFPRCGLFRLPSKEFDLDSISLTLYQSEGCPYSRLVRELLCSLELPYYSISCAEGSSTVLPIDVSGLERTRSRIPILVMEKTDKESGKITTTHFVGHEESLNFLRETFWDITAKQPQLWDQMSPEDNMGQSHQFGASVYLAFLKGRRAFVPPEVEE